MNLPEAPDSLSRILDAWRVAPPRSPRFRAGVWARIETLRKAPAWSDYARAHAGLVATVLAVSVLAGALTGRERARARVTTEKARLADSYVEAMDARFMRMP
ncbi:MAG: hypothetical protein ABIZ81_06645 [Opitutaceae bacterium]